ncbi:MAG: 50S ribosomal protein L29 [Anaerolineales bacterium]|jgi:large subunit ribosomal protein L29|nr:50S ribosomal protein L29 [Anaerolineales bacterium]
MKTVEIRKASTEKIQTYLDDAREDYFKLRFRFTTGQLTDHTRLKIARREIARLATILHERELEIESEGSEK